MGSSFCELYTSRFPHKVVGICNLDGVPYTLTRHVRRKFELAARLYLFESKLVCTGMFRPVIFMLGLWISKYWKHSSMGWNELSIQMNSAQFYSNLGLELFSMLDLCDALQNEWGNDSVSSLSSFIFQSLVEFRPDNRVLVQGVMKDGVFLRIGCDVPKNSSEVFSISTAPAVSLPNPSSVLGLRWRQLPVRVLSCRDYNFFGSSYFLPSSVRDAYAAEHQFQVLLSDASSSHRVIFSNVTHMGGVLCHQELLCKLLVEPLMIDACRLFPLQEDI
jgi:hypothetical protein